MPSELVTDAEICGVIMRHRISAVLGMVQGTLIFSHKEDGNGFFESDDANDDVFFHISKITGAEPEDGEKFEFDIEQKVRGPQAVNVQRL